MLESVLLVLRLGRVAELLVIARVRFRIEQQAFEAGLLGHPCGDAPMVHDVGPAGVIKPVHTARIGIEQREVVGKALELARAEVVDLRLKPIPLPLI